MTPPDNGVSLAVAVAPGVLDPAPVVPRVQTLPRSWGTFGRWLGRLRAVVGPDALGGAHALRFADLSLDPDMREVRRGRRTIELTPIEFRLLELFLRNPRRVLTRSLIFSEVWGFDFGVMSNSLNVAVGNLRRKTEAAGEPRLIHTVRGIGYVLRERR